MIGQQVRQGGEMLWFHSVTIGGSVCSVRKKLHILWKVVNSFLKIQMSNFFQILHLTFMKETNFCETN